MEDLTIDSISLDESQAQLTLLDVPDRPGIAATIFEAIARENVLVDMIVQSMGRDESGRRELHRAADRPGARPVGGPQSWPRNWAAR